MKKQSNNLFETISIEQSTSLKSVVNETIATGLNQANNKAFTAADLWNIQRKGKTCIQRRHSF
jgi:hypothetical protein